MIIKKNIGGTTIWNFETDNLEIEFNLIPKEKSLESSIFVNGYGPFQHSVKDYVTSFTVGNDDYKIVLPNITKGQNHRHLYRNNIDVMNGQKFSFKKSIHKTKWRMVYISCIVGAGLAYYIYKSKKINKCKNAKFKINKEKEFSESRNDISYHNNLLNRGIELKKQVSMESIRSDIATIATTTTTNKDEIKTDNNSTSVNNNIESNSTISEINNNETTTDDNNNNNQTTNNENTNNEATNNETINKEITVNEIITNIETNESISTTATTIKENEMEENNESKNSEVIPEANISTTDKNEAHVDESVSTTFEKPLESEIKNEDGHDAKLSEEANQAKDNLLPLEPNKEQEEGEAINETLSQTVSVVLEVKQVKEENVLNSITTSNDSDTITNNNDS
ncbi:hypothetical protein DICPUDRAFT_159526 [Dictyostelium purpureum]|uniref:Uncharacterized protein n=1 Tax=Dictyostelium purpureum TaxID=5786 RepID=F1A4C5_DICPU|nr:uncharacterized protein DICPUDRAFT_159526 [Dictyostelium purpureum]EGC28957.1 hypothetical protein DICPUDRAFT_159526 [Dictyostelium purpureum]|eukprot:XP_003294516.1 hypothetical protein DICPUDRAFT_159526 [Dictyostelium purpureum]